MASVLYKSMCSVQLLEGENRLSGGSAQVFYAVTLDGATQSSAIQFVLNMSNKKAIKPHSLGRQGRLL